jgi:hypothetical protein
MKLGEQIGPFVIEKALGSGAMGTVFRARHNETGQRVAIKVVAPGLLGNPRSLERFKRESSILKQLKHPNIVRLVATGRYQGTPFYAMEHVEGESLDRVLARRGRVTWEELVTLGQQLAAALQHVHDRGIIHRDLKPSNVMVLPDGTVKLTDFGIAKDVDVTALTAANCTVGTASYMSPEQCRGERDITPRADLYSLGVMFFELLTGRKPFRAESPMELFTLHLQAQPERPSRLVLDIPVWLDTLVLQLLEKDPEQRPFSAATVGEALARVKEKAQAQQSAGADIARSRAVDRKPGARLEEEDKEAARTLLGKKKRKKRAVPFYGRTWFKGAVYASLLVGVVWILYTVLIKKPSPETLYARASALRQKGDFEAARQGPIADFLRYYPGQDDAQARKIREWADFADREAHEQQLLNPPTGPLAPEPQGAEKDARKALDDQKKGDLPTALKEWQALVPLTKEKDEDQHAWGLVAEKYLKDATTATERWQKVTHEVDTEHLKAKPYQGATPLEEKAVQAVRAEGKKEVDKARKQWAELRDEARKQEGERAWELLALWRLRELSEAAPPEKQPPPRADQAGP